MITMAAEQLARFVHEQEAIHDAITVARVDMQAMDAVYQSQADPGNFLIFADGSVLIYAEGGWAERL